MKTRKPFIFFVLFAIFISACVQAQKPVYRATVSENGYDYILKYGADNLLRKERPTGPRDYDIMELQTNNTYTIYMATKRYSSGPRVGIMQMANVTTAKEIGDTVITGYHCKIYQVEADEHFIGKTATELHAILTYYSTTELKYAFDYAPSPYRCFYIPYGGVPGFVLKIHILENVPLKKNEKEGKKKKENVDTGFDYTFRDLKFEPNKPGEVVLPFNK